MSTDWHLIRRTLNDVVDACEALDQLAITTAERCDPTIRWGDERDGVAVGDFLQRFWRYAEGAQRDILRLRTRLDLGDQTHRGELALALAHATAACAEAIGLPSEALDRRDEAFQAHCPSAGDSVRAQLENIGRVSHEWMLPSITEALGHHRNDQGQPRP
ncbi:MAG: hypothetical protein ACOCXA_01430 [Planctomycetota bacterium]